VSEPRTGPILRGRSIRCRPLTLDDVSERYVGWLNDPEVNRYSRRRLFTSSAGDIRAFIAGIGPDEHVLAIEAGEGVHIGNIQFGPIDRAARCAEIRILIGDRSVWGRGYGTEAIYLVTRHMFLDESLHRVEANSCNPAFIRAVQKLGWREEGKLRERFPVDGGFLDYLWFGQLQREFVRRPEHEPR
jgi:ribosomal-protein-alanine N-acetyltransferase